MTNKVHQEMLRKIITRKEVSGLEVISSGFLEITLEFNKEVIDEDLNHLEFETETLSDNKLRITKIPKRYNIYWNTELFLEELKDHNFSDILVIDLKERNFVFFESSTKTTFRNSEVSHDFTITNTIYYNKVKRLLLDLSHDIDSFHFIDIANSDARKFIFISEKNGKRATINYPLASPQFEEDIAPTYLLIHSVLIENPSKEFPRFLKASIIDELVSGFKPLSLKDFLLDFGRIHRLARLNFSIYLNDISVDKLKSDYSAYKEKYLSKYAELLNKLSAQIIAFPVSISAFIFLIHRLKGENIALSILVVALIFLIIYADLILRIYIQEIHNLEEIITEDFDLVLKKDLFIDFAEEKDYFMKIKRRLMEKNASLRNLVLFYLPVIYIGVSFLLSYISYQIFGLDSVSLLVLSITLLLSISRIGIFLNRN